MAMCGLSSSLEHGSTRQHGCTLPERRAWHVLSVPFCAATVATRHNGTKCAKFNAPRKRNQMIGSVSRPHTAQKETTKPSRLLTAQTVAIGMARGEYSSHSTSIRLMYLSHMTRYSAIRHQPAKPASPTLNQNMASCLPLLSGSYEATTTSGSLMYQASAAATTIHSSADSFLKAYSSHVLSLLPSGSSSEEVSGPNGVSSTCS